MKIILIVLALLAVFAALLAVFAFAAAVTSESTPTSGMDAGQAANYFCRERGGVASFELDTVIICRDGSAHQW